MQRRDKYDRAFRRRREELLNDAEAETDVLASFMEDTRLETQEWFETSEEEFA